MPTRLTQGSCQLSALTVHTERRACEAELSPSSELTFCLFSYGKGCSSGRFTRSQEQSNEIRSGSVWTERRHHTRRKAGIGLEQRAASPVAGWWAGLALWPAVLPPPPTPRLTSAALPVSSDSPPSRGPESHASQGHEAAGACRRAGTCAGGGLYRCWETPARSGSVLLAPELLLDVHGALLAPGRAGSPLPWGCVRAETGPSPGGHWGQGGRSASSPASPAGQAPGSSVKTP